MESSGQCGTMSGDGGEEIAPKNSGINEEVTVENGQLDCGGQLLERGEDPGQCNWETLRSL